MRLIYPIIKVKNSDILLQAIIWVEVAIVVGVIIATIIYEVIK
jgi:hypothetical protein